jgi:hypothetical protein
MLAVVLFTALPKVYLHKLMGHNHVIEQVHDSNADTHFNADNKTQNCDLEKFETPVYFTIFKFILNCSPFRHSSDKVSDNYKQKDPIHRDVTVLSLRGPPTV